MYVYACTKVYLPIIALLYYFSFRAASNGRQEGKHNERTSRTPNQRHLVTSISRFVSVRVVKCSLSYYFSSTRALIVSPKSKEKIIIIM